jgi:xanthine dehydrogenase small subunit
MADIPRIVLNGRPTTIDDVPATTTLLDWLRDHARLRGTKEGCAEGDCGACTVVLERLTSDGCLNRSAINSCLTMVGQVDGVGVRTVEGLVCTDGTLHPVQKAFAEGAGTQCGFCTPGLVMAAYAFAVATRSNELSLIHDAIAGNLCRCTGYRPVIEAISRVLSKPNRSCATPLPQYRVSERLPLTTATAGSLYRSHYPRHYLCVADSRMPSS